jgi:hypothetical protein
MFGNAAGKPSSIAASLFVANESDEIIFHSRCTSAWCLILSVNLLVGVLVLHDGVARISSQDMACRDWLGFPSATKSNFANLVFHSIYSIFFI